MADDVTMARLDDQIAWYDRRSARNQKYYQNLKICVIVFGALIPLLSGVALPFDWLTAAPRWLLGALGGAIAVIEGIQQVNQYHTSWISYRSTCEALKHEKYLYLAAAGPYAATANARALLAERVEALVSQEHAKWASFQARAERTQQAARDDSAGG